MPLAASLLHPRLVGRRHRLLPARDRAPARRAGLRLPHHVGRRHGGVPGGRRLPAVCRRRAGRRAHAPSLRGDVTAQRHDAAGNRKPVRTAIATVCLSGTLRREARGHRRREVQGRRDLRERSPVVQRHAGRSAPAWSPTSGSRSSPSSPSATSRACRSRSAARRSRRAERKFDVMEELGCDLLLVCSNVSPDCARRHRPRRRRFPRARRARRKARPARRLRGAGLGPPRQRLPRRLGGRAPRRPPGGRARPRLLPHPGAQDRPDADPRDPQGPHLPGAARRRAAARHGLPLLEPPLTALSRPGRAAGRRLHGRAARPPATTGFSRSRSSTTASAPARRAASRSTGSAR